MLQRSSQKKRNPRLNILVLTTLFPNLIQTNRAVFTKQLCVKLRDYADVRVVAPVPYFPPIKGFGSWSQYHLIPKEEHGDITVYHPRYLVMPKLEILTGFFYFIACLRIVRHIRKQFQFDVLNVHWAYPDGFAGMLLGIVFNVPVVITAHGSDIYLYSKYPGVRRLLRWTMNKANSVVAVSKALKSAIETMCAKCQVEVIPCAAVDPLRFQALDKVQCRKELGLPGNKKIVLFVGNLVRVKGVKHLIEAFGRLTEAGHKDVLLILVGDGSDKAALQDHVRRHDLEPFVLVAGRKTHQEIPLWMNSADLFCLPSLSEGMPNVVIEAMACGTPVIATKVGGVPDIINSDLYGYVVPPADSAALSKAIERAFSVEWDHQAISDFARQITWDSIAKRYIGLFELLLSKQRSCIRKEGSCL
jgi:teichuronic acid biosynthesis glycosyltransferase TuaC